MAGKIVADTLEHSTAGSIATNYVVNGSAKVWNSTNGGVIDDSFNVSSNLDNGSGDYTTNFSNAMVNALYAQTNHFFFEGTGSSYGYISQNADRAASSLRNYGRRNTSGTLSDTQGCISINGDLA